MTYLGKRKVVGTKSVPVCILRRAAEFRKKKKKIELSARQVIPFVFQPLFSLIREEQRKLRLARSTVFYTKP